MDSADDLVLAIRPIKKILETLNIPYFVGGSVASSYHGAMRSTMDVDLVAVVSLEQLESLVAAVADDFYASESAIRAAIENRTSFNLIHLPTSFKVDVFVSRGRPFDESSFARATICRIGSNENGVELPVASVEDILAAKLDWYRIGDEASERQWNDLTRLVRLHGTRIDWKYLHTVASELKVDDLLVRLKPDEAGKQG
jgi:hypothetical protein